jgi:hypothetical protein
VVYRSYGVGVLKKFVGGGGEGEFFQICKTRWEMGLRLDCSMTYGVETRT